LHSPTIAQEASDFYRGKTIRIVVGGSAGGAYDTAARLVANHMARHVPGAPSIVVENMAGAASLQMANYVYNRASHDGTVIGMPNSNILLEPRLKLLSRSGGRVEFDLNRFIWLGTAMQEPQIMWVMSSGAVKSVDDAKTKETIIGATAVGADNYTLSVILNGTLGTRLKLISGYAGPPEILLAAERGEVEGSIGALSNLTVGKQEWWRAGKLRVLVQFGRERHPTIKDVPTAIELAERDADAQMFRFIALKFKMARVFFLPPDTLASRVEVLRRAFDETMSDPAFLRQSSTIGLDVNPIDGAGTTKLVQEIQETPDAVVDKLRTLIEPTAR
jgi:tripartite-type tricarboxylate transporter receptor subunit TctC